MGSVSDCSCLSWATTSVLFSFRADTGKIKKVITKSNNINLDVHGLTTQHWKCCKAKFTAKSIPNGVNRQAQQPFMMSIKKVLISCLVFCKLALEKWRWACVYTYYGGFPSQEKGSCTHPWRSPPCSCHWGDPVFHEAALAHCRSTIKKEEKIESRGGKVAQ